MRTPRFHHFPLPAPNTRIISWLVLRNIAFTNASVKSYQLVKVVSGGRAPGKSSSLASPQLLVMNNFIVLVPCAWKKFIFFIALIFEKYI